MFGFNGENMQKPDSALLRINLLESYDTMLDTLSAFCTALRSNETLPIWVSRSDQEIEQGLKMRDKAVMLYQALWYEDGQDGRETLTCPGLIAASADTLKAAHYCNDAKDAFKASVLALKKLSKGQAEAVMTDLHARDREVALSMRRMGAARLNLKQAYRHIPLLNTCPLKVGFTWSKQGRTIQRTTVAEARRLLEQRKDSPQVRSELERLAQIPETEMLARVRSVSPHLRANIVFPAHSAGPENGEATQGAKSDDGLVRRLMQAPLPILVPAQAGGTLPDFIPIPPEPVGSSRLKRSDVRIEDEPFLPLIRVHRYQMTYR
jgi:hypothetical protein